MGAARLGRPVGAARTKETVACITGPDRPPPLSPAVTTVVVDRPPKVDGLVLLTLVVVSAARSLAALV